MVVFSEDSLRTKLLELREKEKPLVLVTHDESIFSANNEKRRI